MTERRFPVLLSRLSLLLGLAALASAASAAPRLCKPTLSIKDAQFSKWELPSMERRWTATVAVDASRCTANASGYFEIGFLRAKEYGMNLEFREQFVWMSPQVQVGIDVWADEAVEAHWIDKVSPCTCRD